MTQPLDLAALRKEAEFCAKTNSILYVFPTRILTLIEDVERLRAYVRELEDETTPAFTRIREALTVAREALEPLAQWFDGNPPRAIKMSDGRRASAAIATLDAALAEGGAG